MSKPKKRCKRNRWQTTFAEIRLATRQTAAENAWNRGEYASSLRHALRADGQFGAARRLGEIKAVCVQRAIDLATKPVRIRTHYVQGIRYRSVQFKAKKWRALHLPITVPLRLDAE